MTKATIIPNLRYADAPSAIAFLCDAFGFEQRAVYPDEQEPGVISHAQLTMGDSMIMLATAQDSPWTRASGMKTVAEAGANTQSVYVVVADVDAHCAQARAAGAKIIMEPEDQDYGGRNYGARDPEGNVWSFGSYDPWA
jgi:uncharacterized glyoxalase superfamily protein PhnB